MQPRSQLADDHANAKRIAERVVYETWSAWGAIVPREVHTLDRFSYEMYRRMTALLADKGRIIQCCARIAGSDGHKTVLREIFADGIINWGRIVVAYTYMMCAARHERDLENGNMNVLCDLVRFVQNELCGWIAACGGWVRRVAVCVCLVKLCISQDAFIDAPRDGGLETIVCRGAAYLALLQAVALAMLLILSRN